MIYEKIKEILEEKNITFYQLSKDTGITEATFSTWKYKKTNPNVKTLNILAKYLGISVNDLLDEKKIEISDEEIKTNKEKNKIYNSFKELNEENQNIIKKLINALKKNQ